ncbi:MAG: UDP-N-acetylenolpyruvoylglucosamine reductase [Bacillota bacterium]|nr:UDP-N-acetylenolpyruvoylglucosamine reductase [Bacillota bacterium]
MTETKKEAVALIEQLTEKQTDLVVQLLKSIAGLGRETDNANRESAFRSLERLRKPLDDLDYEKELREYREERYHADIS